MTRTEIYSWLVSLSICALAWLAAGVPGLLCLIAGAIVSQIDVSWIEDWHTVARRAPEAQPLEKKWRRMTTDDFKPSARQRAARMSVKRASNVVEFPAVKTAERASSRKRS